VPVVHNGDETRLSDPARLEALERTGLVDTAAEEAFDRLTRLAVALTNAPISLITLVLPERQFFKSVVGLDEPWLSARETPLSHSFCQFPVRSGERLVVEDARTDPRLCENLAIRDLRVVAYAGTPLRTADGHVLGTLCVIDTQPRRWSDEQLARLDDLAELARGMIELRVLQARAGDDERTVAIARASGPSQGPGLNIEAFSRRTGVAPDTLRKWERRYGILRPARTEHGQRRYDEHDVDVVRWLKARLDQGYRIGEAAALLGGDGDPAESPQELRELIVAAAAAGDDVRVARLLDQAFAMPSLEEAFTAIVVPALRDVGEAWEAGRLDVAAEHLVSSAVRARVGRLLADAREGVRGSVTLACAPGERHELGLMTLAVMLRRDGWRVAYLGADTPLRDAVAFAARTGSRALCLSATTADRLGDLKLALAEVDVPQPPEIVLGGAAVTAERAAKLGVRYGGGDAAAAVEQLRALAA